MTNPAHDLAYPWERRTTESEVAWRAFQHYRDAPLGESSHGTTAQWLIDQGHVKGIYKTVRTNVGAWSSTNEWVERRTAWLAEQDHRRRTTYLEANAEMHKRNATQLMAAIRLVSEPINSLVRDLANRESDVRRHFDRLPVGQRMDLALRCAKALPKLMAAEAYSRGETPMPLAVAGVASPDAEQVVESDLARTRRVYAALEQAGWRPEPAGGEVQ